MLSLCCIVTGKNSNRYYFLYIISQIDFNLRENMSLWLKLYFRLRETPPNATQWIRTFFQCSKLALWKEKAPYPSKGIFISIIIFKAHDILGWEFSAFCRDSVAYCLMWPLTFHSSLSLHSKPCTLTCFLPLFIPIIWDPKRGADRKLQKRGGGGQQSQHQWNGLIQRLRIRLSKFIS